MEQSHRIIVTDRQAASVTGVKDVISFDLTTILLETEQGMLTIQGHDLHVNRLSLEQGELNVSGSIDGVTYSAVESYAKKSESFFARLLK